MIKNVKLYDANKYNNLKELVDETVKLYPNNTAFVLKQTQGKDVKYKNITFDMFGKDINYLGTRFITMGLKGKRIAVIGKNRYEWCVSYLATSNGVGIIIPLDKGLPEAEIELSLKRSKADVIIFEEKNLDIIKNIKRNNNTNVKYYICMDDVNDSEILNLSKLIEEGKEEIKTNKEFLEAKIDSEKMSILVFTSGTTSLSKAVMLSHKNIVENIYSLDCVIKTYESDTSLAFLPFHHTFGWTGFLFFFKNGVTHAFCDGIKHIQENLKEYKISIFVCVPLLLEAMYKKINITIEKQGMTKKVKFGKKLSNILLKFGIDIRRKIFKQIIDQLGGNIRLAVSGAAGIDKEVSKGFNEFGIEAVQGYGLTETSPVISAENDKYIRYGSVGFPLVNVDVKIDNPNKDGIGEVIAKGPNVMLRIL